MKDMTKIRAQVSEDLNSVKNRRARLTALIDNFGYDLVAAASGVAVSSLATFLKKSSTTTMSYLTLEIAEKTLNKYSN